jgi:hypothetical protein
MVVLFGNWCFAAQLVFLFYLTNKITIQNLSSLHQGS